MLVVVYTIKYVYVYNAVPAWHIHDTCMGHACISIIGTTGVPELADRLFNYSYYCTLLAWLVVATMKESTG